jgi:mono/diheme cytochrome c family protein
MKTDLSLSRLSAVLLAALLVVKPKAAPAAPVISGLAAEGLTPELRGQILVEELNCAACHQSEGSLASRSKQAPRLAEIGSRVNPAYVEAFLSDPHGVKPGTTMPDVLGRMEAAEKAETAKALTHYLMSLKAPQFAPAPPDHVAAVEGHRLFHSRGCAACHAPRNEQAVEQPVAHAVPLGALERKYSQASLVKFLREPHVSRPSGRMPDLKLDGREIERIAHFLLQHTRVPGALRYTLYRGQVWDGLQGQEVRPERGGHVVDFALTSLGRVDQHSAVRYEGWVKVEIAGTYRFFVTMNGGSLEIGGKTVVKEDPSDQRGVKSFEGTVELGPEPLPIQFTYFHTGRKAELKLEVEGPGLPRGPVPPDWLTVEKEPVAPYQTLKVDAALAGRGREAFSKLGCANCHSDVKAPLLEAPALAKLEAARDCMSGNAGVWPQFGLSAEQRDWIRLALPKVAEPALDDTGRIHKTLAALNCIACHDRAGLGGPSQERRALFTGTQPSLGDQGRIPPPLTGVGAKLTRQWMEAVLLHGARQRDYVDAAMPQFGEAQVVLLVEQFARVDKLEQSALPKVAQLVESKAAGYELVGSEGLGCIACHEFNGQKAGEISALDIAFSPQRLQRNWFDLYMRQPSRFHPTVIMPGFWPDGKSVRPNVLKGDSAMQIEAIWNYLSDGERARKPAGLSRQTNELRVGDVAEICRGRGPAGYRGIGVGYPERVNLAFDSGEMALRLLWRGGFANVDMGSFHARGSDQITLPPGIPFHRLKSAEDSWPSKGKTNHGFPQDHGYEWLGYALDAKRRPVFRYRYGDITVEDFFEDVPGEGGRAFFRRTLKFNTPAAQEPFQFRAAAGQGIERVSEREFRVGKQLTLRLGSGSGTPVVREGSTAELLLPLKLPAGETILVIEYLW